MARAAGQAKVLSDFQGESGGEFVRVDRVGLRQFSGQCLQLLNLASPHDLSLEQLAIGVELLELARR